MLVLVVLHTLLGAAVTLISYERCRLSCGVALTLLLHNDDHLLYAKVKGTALFHGRSHCLLMK